MVRFKGKEDPYPAAEPNGFLLHTFQAASISSISSVRLSAYAPNQSPKEEGIAICKWVYPGSNLFLCSSLWLINWLKSSSVFLTIPWISLLKNSLRSTRTWSFRDLPLWIFFPASPTLRVSNSSTCECTSSTSASILNLLSLISLNSTFNPAWTWSRSFLSKRPILSSIRVCASEPKTSKAASWLSSSLSFPTVNFSTEPSVFVSFCQSLLIVSLWNL